MVPKPKTDMWKEMWFYVTVWFQVGQLYIRYQLDVADDEDSVIELQDVPCLLKDEKELYIQKDHIHEKLEILRFVCSTAFSSAVKRFPSQSRQEYMWCFGKVWNNEVWIDCGKYLFPALLNIC